MLEIRNMEDACILMEGVKVLGTGGGGIPSKGLALMKKDFEEGRTYRFVDGNSIADSSLIASGGFIGSVTDPIPLDMILEGWEKLYEPLEALRILEQYAQKKVDYVIPFELGATNTPAIMSLAARAGIAIIDGDGVGRAAPETQMCSFNGLGASLTPMSYADNIGNKVLVADSSDQFYPDDVGRFMVTHKKVTCANAHYIMSGAQLKECAVLGSINHAYELGKIIVNSEAEKTDAVGAVAKYMHGVTAIKGVVANIEKKEQGGFYYNMLSINGEEAFKNSKAVIAIKNETMVCWVNGEISCIFPDLILMLDSETGKGIMTAELAVGQKVSIVLAPCSHVIRKAISEDKGRKAFSPERFGYSDISYVPLEKLIACAI